MADQYHPYRRRSFDDGRPPMRVVQSPVAYRSQEPPGWTGVMILPDDNRDGGFSRPIAPVVGGPGAAAGVRCEHRIRVRDIPEFLKQEMTQPPGTKIKQFFQAGQGGQILEITLGDPPLPDAEPEPYHAGSAAPAAGTLSPADIKALVDGMRQIADQNRQLTEVIQRMAAQREVATASTSPRKGDDDESAPPDGGAAIIDPAPVVTPQTAPVANTTLEEPSGATSPIANTAMPVTTPIAEIHSPLHRTPPPVHSVSQAGGWIGVRRGCETDPELPGLVDRRFRLHPDPDGPAFRAGIRDGDRAEENEFMRLSRRVRQMRPGESVELKIWRGETELRFDIVLGLPPDAPAEAPERAAAAAVGKAGSASMVAGAPASASATASKRARRIMAEKPPSVRKVSYEYRFELLKFAERDPRLKPAHVRLLAYLIKVRMNHEGHDAWPHQQTIASDLNMKSRQHVNQLITELVRFGYLWVSTGRDPGLKRHGTRAKVMTFYLPATAMLCGKDTGGDGA